MLTHTSQADYPASAPDRQKIDLDKRLAILFWPLLLILLGTIWLFPVDRVPVGTFLTGIGLILLGLNAARLLNGIPVRVLPTVLGVVALAAGLAEFAGAELPIVPLSLIAIGVSIVPELFHARKT
jgi:hypothetical protein